jgi:hypothetical protein
VRVENDADFASHQTPEALNAAAMVTACEETPRRVSQQAVITRLSPFGWERDRNFRRDNYDKDT